MAARKPTATRENADSLARKQREISVSEFFLKNRHLLGFDNPRRALLTAVKEAVDNALDACEEGGILPEVAVDIRQSAEKRFRVVVTDNGPGIVRVQVPRIFAKLLYGSKFHRLRMSRGQQGIGISAAVMYAQLTTGTAAEIFSRTGSSGSAHRVCLMIDTRRNKPTIVSDDAVDWQPSFPPAPDAPDTPPLSAHGTAVAIELEASYVRGRLSVDEYLRQCAIVNPHLRLHYRIVLAEKGGKADGSEKSDKSDKSDGSDTPDLSDVTNAPWTTFQRQVDVLPPAAQEIKPHPHGVELGMLIQILKDAPSRTLRGVLCESFSRVSARAALDICTAAGLSPKANPSRIAHNEAEALFNAIGQTKLMRPPTDCLAPIGEDLILTGLRKEIPAEFYTSVTRPPAVYRGNPFQVEVGLACAQPGASQELAADQPVRVLRFANRVPLLYMNGACAITKAVGDVNWKAYGLQQSRGGIPLGPVAILVHIASVWVPFTSESKEAIAHYPEILKEIVFALQEAGRRLSLHLGRRRRDAERDRKRNYILLYIPHLARGLRDVLALDDPAEQRIVDTLSSSLERSHLET